MVSALTLAGAMAFRIVEPYSTNSFFEAIWWSLVTLSTVGYGDVMPRTPDGRIVAMVLIVAGIGVFGYAAGFVAQLFSDPEEDEILQRVKAIQEQVELLARAQTQVAAENGNEQ
jgi:voltage-gated potassium channel